MQNKLISLALIISDFFLQMYESAPKSAHELLLLSFLVNFSGSSFWKVLFFVDAFAFKDKAVESQYRHSHLPNNASTAAVA